MTYALGLFDSLGHMINVQKSVLVPAQEVEFLGIVRNSTAMTATLPSCRKDRIKESGRALLRGPVTLHGLTSFIGLAVAFEPAVELAPVKYNFLEIIRNRELARNKGNYLSKIALDSHVKDLIIWWVQNVDLQSKSLRSSFSNVELYTDACLTGWGVSMNDVRRGGH